MVAKQNLIEPAAKLLPHDTGAVRDLSQLKSYVSNKENNVFCH